MLWELSTPFVYIRWFLVKMGYSDTKAYKLNGIMMLLVFFLCRNVVGLGKLAISVGCAMQPWCLE